MYICIGKIVDAHHLKGEVKVRFISENPQWVDDLKTLYLSADDSGEHLPDQVDKIPAVEVLKIRKTNELWILQLSGVEDRNQAETLKRQYLFVSKDFFKTEELEDPYLLELQGYQVIVEGQVRGKIISFLETQAHNLILIKNEQGEFEIPWVEAFIKAIKREEQIVEMSFPLDLLSEDFNVKAK